MRLDPQTSTSHGSRNQSNGSPLSPPRKARIPGATNGHSSPNGTSSSHTNGTSPSRTKTKSNTYYGHDREEVTRLLIQGLKDLGYETAAENLERESGFEVEKESVVQFRNAVRQGEWLRAEALLFGSNAAEDGGGVSISNGDSHHYEGIRFAHNTNQDELRFRMREQKYLELLEQGHLPQALTVLRKELGPLNQDISKLHELSSLIVCQTPDDLKKQAQWKGASGGSRDILLADLSRSISPSTMIPDHRLAVLLNQVKQTQISKCLYHNPSTPPSLFADHICDRSQFPLRTIAELDNKQGEVWSVDFSHNGRYLATSGQGSNVVIYDIARAQTQHTLREHSAHVPYLTWSPDDSKLITCSHDHTAKVWDTATGKCILTIDHHAQPVTTASWAPNGTEFVTGSLDRSSQLCLWRLNGNRLHRWDTDYRIQDCAISPDGKRLVTISSECQIFIYNFITKEELRCLTFKTKMTCISISKDSKYMLVNMADGEVQLLEIETKESTTQVTRRFLGQKQKEFVIRSSFGGADENLVISGSEDTKIYIWHKENGTLIETLEGHKDGCVNAVAWNPADPCMFASAGDDGIVRIWSKESAHPSPRRLGSQSPSYSGQNGSTTVT